MKNNIILSKLLLLALLSSPSFLVELVLSSTPPPPPPPLPFTGTKEKKVSNKLDLIKLPFSRLYVHNYNDSKTNLPFPKMEIGLDFLGLPMNLIDFEKCEAFTYTEANKFELCKNNNNNNKGKDEDKEGCGGLIKKRVFTKISKKKKTNRKITQFYFLGKPPTKTQNKNNHHDNDDDDESNKPILIAQCNGKDSVRIFSMNKIKRFVEGKPVLIVLQKYLSGIFGSFEYLDPKTHPRAIIEIPQIKRKGKNEKENNNNNNNRKFVEIGMISKNGNLSTTNNDTEYSFSVKVTDKNECIPSNITTDLMHLGKNCGAGVKLAFSLVKKNSISVILKGKLVAHANVENSTCTMVKIFNGNQNVEKSIPDEKCTKCSKIIIPEL